MDGLLWLLDQLARQVRELTAERDALQEQLRLIGTQADPPTIR